MTPRALSRTIQSVRGSMTAAIEEEARRLIREGRSILSFAEGEPDMPTPLAIREAAVRAMHAGATRYTDVAGTRDLREAIAAYVSTTERAGFTADEVIVTAGGKAAVHNALAVLCDPGDEVIIPAPCWVSFPEQVKLLGATPVLVPCDDAFALDVAAITAAIGSRTKALVLNSPNNPTGAIYRSEDLQSLIRICADRGVYVLLDQVYDRLYYGAPPAHALTLVADARDNLILINSFSKTYAMTGWRLGYAVGPRPVITAMTTLQSHSSGNPSAIAQAAALWALANSTDYVTMREVYATRRSRIVHGLRALPGVQCHLPDGAFYVFPDIRGLYDALPERYPRDSWGIAEWWLRDAGVATVPGDAFFGPDHVRLCYAVSDDRIEEGLRRLAALVDAAGGRNGARVGGRHDQA